MFVKKEDNYAKWYYRLRLFGSVQVDPVSQFFLFPIWRKWIPSVRRQSLPAGLYGATPRAVQPLSEGWSLCAQRWPPACLPARPRLCTFSACGLFVKAGLSWTVGLSLITPGLGRQSSARLRILWFFRCGFLGVCVPPRTWALPGWEPLMVVPVFSARDTSWMHSHFSLVWEDSVCPRVAADLMEVDGNVGFH